MDGHLSRGLTLVELLTVIAVLAILITIGMPAMASFLQHNRLRSAAEALALTLHTARAETIARPAAGQQVHVSFHRNPHDPTDWCFGLHRGSNCDCRLDDLDNAASCTLELAGAKVLKTVSAREYPGTALSEVAFGAGNDTWFNPVRGTARSGHVSFRNHRELRVVLSPLGRARLCSPRNAYLHGYPQCG